MEVRLVPNQLRPCVGRRPARENRRAFLPQHARMLSMVEDANRLGFLVYPPLHDHESVQIHARGNGALAITLFVGNDRGQRAPAFVAEVTRSAGPGGLDRMEIAVVDEDAGFDEATAQGLLAALTSGINAPPGTVGLRGTHSFITPEGWDTVYAAVLNDPQRPAVGVLAVRAETDWFPYETEFRYLLEKGDIVSIIGSGPIGQVFFLPRTEDALADASPAEQERFGAAARQYVAAGARTARMTRYGGAFSYLYPEEQKARRSAAGGAHGLLQDPGPPPVAP